MACVYEAYMILIGFQCLARMLHYGKYPKRLRTDQCPNLCPINVTIDGQRYAFQRTQRAVSLRDWSITSAANSHSGNKAIAHFKNVSIAVFFNRSPSSTNSFSTSLIYNGRTYQATIVRQTNYSCQPRRLPRHAITADRLSKHGR